MHFEILVEDQSGKIALDILLKMILRPEHTYKVHPYKGIGRIPKKMTDTRHASKRILLENLPKLLKGYGKTFAGYPGKYVAAVVVVCDLDDKCLKEYRQEMMTILEACNPRPNTRFCMAVEEGEAWFLGDFNAVKMAYPQAKQDVLDSYENDSICGTWEKLADAIYSGGADALAKKGWQAVGTEKAAWATNITPFMDVDANKSPSFGYFRKKLEELSVGPEGNNL